MIEVVLEDGTRRPLHEAEVTLTWKAPEDDEAESSYTLDDVKAMLVVNPNVGTMAGMFRGMPIMAVALTSDEPEIRFEVPMPLGFANDMGQQLVKETDRFAAQVKLAGGNGTKALQRYQSLPVDLPPPPSG